jgi:hypothetical protein
MQDTDRMIKKEMLGARRSSMFGAWNEHQMKQILNPIAVEVRGVPT